ncbi:pro-sigmaK processing inhibitor BofA family protein [Caldalkalibacillus salinus]|uniref:pro-sigmaK processing inhibitor BofA family protein n=1 Tax=Caldalkalibacillus salinus TaxID=2803787 RepID=UPI00192193AB|nr:pro-sigmaK processing inhibitor BofA family protein [Caldalkalibacillus salinus]
MDMYPIGVMIIVTLLFLILNHYRWKPVQWFGKGVIHLMMGAAFLFVFNIFADYFSLYIPLNIITVAVAGFLGLPGVAALACLKMMM